MNGSVWFNGVHVCELKMEKLIIENEIITYEEYNGKEKEDIR